MKKTLFTEEERGELRDLCESSALSRVKVGSKLSVERQPILSRTQPPAERTSTKVVTKVEDLKDGRLAIKLKGMYVRLGDRTKIPRPFIMQGNDQRGYRLFSYSVNPKMKYLVIAIDGRAV